MNILALDFGTKNVGVAFADAETGIARPVCIFDAPAIENIVEMCERRAVDKIVVGLPTPLGGGENAQTARVKKWAENVKNETELPVEFADERFSSTGRDDAGAACVILEVWQCANGKIAGNDNFYEIEDEI